MNFADLQELFGGCDQDRGALFCEPETFLFLCKVERRRLERESRLPLVYVGLLDLTSTAMQLSTVQLKEAMEQLQDVLLKNLRKSDVLSRWNETQFVFFLPGLNLEQAERAVRRICLLCRAACPAKDLVLQGSIYPLSPWGK